MILNKENQATLQAQSFMMFMMAAKALKNKIEQMKAIDKNRRLMRVLKRLQPCQR